MAKRLEVELANDIETTVKMLNELGYTDNEQGKDNPVFADDDGWFFSIKTNHKEKIAIMLEYDGSCDLYVYRYKGEERDHREVFEEIDYKPYYEELVTQGILK